MNAIRLNTFSATGEQSTTLGDCFFLDLFSTSIKFELLSGPKGREFDKKIAKKFKCCTFARTPPPLRLDIDTKEPWFNEVPRDWGNWFTISRFFSIHYTIIGLKNVVRYTEDFVI